MSPRTPRTQLSRRTVLRGAGVALALPWLESLQPRSARAQASSWPLRFMPIFLPTGAPDFWKPEASGSGADWALSSVLEPLSALKSKVAVVSGLENGSVFNADGSSSVEPSHGRQPGAWLTCSDAAVISAALNVDDANGVSVDQLAAAHPAFNATAIPSLQLSLSTVEGFCDGRPCSLSRSVSWRTETEPLHPNVDPKQVFQQLVGAVPGALSDAALKQLASRASVLDAVLESAAAVQPRLGAADKLKMDEFLASVRDVEQRVTQIQMPQCELPLEPVFPDVTSGSYQQNTDTYDKGTHADLMNDLIVLAFQCDLTRVISYMLGDEYCEFVYSHVPMRTFTATSSAPSSGVCGDYHGAQHAGVNDNGYATITWWNVGKVAAICQRLSAIEEGDGQSLLDHSVIFLGSCMHGSNHQCADLPALLVGGGGGRLRTDQHLALENRPMRDFYTTLMNGVFGMDVADLGVNRTGAPASLIEELLL